MKRLIVYRRSIIRCQFDNVTLNRNVPL